MILSAALAFVLFTGKQSHAAELSEALNEANTFYQKGDCNSAIPAYKKIAENSSSTEANKNLAQFRMAYCYLDMKELEAAIAGFRAVVEKLPQQDEARLRLAQALAQNEQHHEAVEEALKVKDPSYQFDAVLLAAQENLELGETELAIRELSSMKVENDWFAIYSYWLGVANYRDGDTKKAESYFNLALTKSSPNLWTISESKNWLNTISKDKQWIHGSASLGYFVDGNVAQESIVAVDIVGNPFQFGPLQTSYYTDHGYIVSTALNLRLVNEKDWSLFSNFSFSTPQYSVYTNYDNEVYTAALASSYKISSFWNTDFTVKYIDSRYANVYYQDYLSFQGGVNAQLTNKLSMRFDVPYTMYMDTTFSKSLGLNLSGRYAFPFGTAFLGESFYKLSGNTASFYISGNSAALLSGTMFTNYQTWSTYLGATIPVIHNYNFTGQASYTAASYGTETIPKGTTQYGAQDRADKTWVLSGELAGPILPEVWFISLSYTYTTDKSVGLQGLPSSGQAVNYNYTRPYWLLNTTVNF